MSATSKCLLTGGTSADGSYGLVVTPEPAGRGYSGLRVLALGPGDQVVGEGGFGCQGAYGSAERPIDMLAGVRSGDTVPSPRGRRGPSIAAPGHGLHHLDVVAGPGQDRAGLNGDDPARGWVRGTWAAQDTDDRLPFGENR